MPKRFLAGVVAAVVMAGAAVAGPFEASGLAERLAHPNGQKACFIRDYSHSHLAAHPDQLVTSMSLNLIKRHPSSENQAGPDYDFIMSAKLRGETQTLYTGGWCFRNPEGYAPLRCDVPCDGGSIIVEPTATDQNAIRVLLDFPGAVGYITMSPKCFSDAGEEGMEVALEPGKDDRLFQLFRTSPENCRPLDEWETAQ